MCLCNQNELITVPTTECVNCNAQPKVEINLTSMAEVIGEEYIDDKVENTT